MLLHAMGSKAAHVHLGSRRTVKALLSDLRHRKVAWLRNAARRWPKPSRRNGMNTERPEK
jgi:predicted metal-dependent RNase